MSQDANPSHLALTALSLIIIPSSYSFTVNDALGILVQYNSAIRIPI